MHGILRLCGAGGHAGEQTGSLVKGADFERGDVPMCEAMVVHHLSDGVNGGVGPAADRIGLDVIIGHGPAGAESVPELRHIWRLNRNGRRAGEAALREKSGCEADQRAHARAVMEHRRVVNLAHHLAAGAVVFGDAHGVAEDLRL